MVFPFNQWQEKSQPLVHVDIGFLADDVGESATNTFNGGQSEHDLLFPIDVSVEHTQNVLKLFVRYQRLPKKKKKPSISDNQEVEGS